MLVCDASSDFNRCNCCKLSSVIRVDEAFNTSRLGMYLNPTPVIVVCFASCDFSDGRNLNKLSVILASATLSDSRHVKCLYPSSVVSVWDASNVFTPLKI